MTAGMFPELSPEAPLPFAQIRAEHVEAGLHDRLEAAKAALRAVATETEAPASWSTVFEALEQATEALELAYAVVTHLESVRTTPELRAAYNTVKPEISAFFASIPLDAELYARLQALEAAETSLSPDRARALERTLDDFRRHGANLDGESKARLEALSRELASVTAKFGQNVLDATSSWSKLVPEAGRLAGLPDTAMAAARAAAESAGQQGWMLTLHAPSLIPALTYLEDGALREEIYRAYYVRASEAPRDNGPLISEILKLRAEQAQLLGYDNFADLVLEPRMAGKGAKARAFVADLTARTQSAFKRETEELVAFRKELEGPDAPALEPWDVAFYAEKLRKMRFDFDDEALRPYFEVGQVMRGVFEIAERLYGVVIEPDASAPGWHPDVEGWRVKEGDQVLGRFYTDLHPRDDKRGGAWMHGLSSGVVTAGGGLDRPHLGLFAANLTPPVDGRALLTHDEVQTIFHEFGHLLHHLLSRVGVRSQAGTRVAWDFVELPSQIMENWCWSRAALDVFARHHETGERIPEPLFERMQAARTFRSATAMMRQLGFAEVDLALHLDFDPSSGEDPIAFARTAMADYSPVPLYEGWAFLAGFTHLFSSATAYAAGYYSYKWAEVLDADAFSRFEAKGGLDPNVGKAFRQTVLEIGDSVPPEEAFEAFMGRAPNAEALLVRSGLA